MIYLQEQNLKKKGLTAKWKCKNDMPTKNNICI